MLQDELDDDLDAGEHVALSSAARFQPDDIDLDGSDDGLPRGGEATETDELTVSPAAVVAPAREFLATTEDTPGPWVLPPSKTRKRTRAKPLIGSAASSSLKPDAQGQWPCVACGALYPNRTGLYGHLRFCPALDGWRCEWCQCGAHETHHKANGPKGPRTLCSACSTRFRAGQQGPPPQNDAGEYMCDQCERSFSTLAALGGHRRFCDGGVWRCSWCECRADQTQGKGPGPGGPMTLCAPCSSRFRAGHLRPPARDESGKYLCEECGRSFDSIPGLGSHRTRCDGGAWACDWCKCKPAETSGKGPGPRGTKTLCSVCSARYRSGHSGPPDQDEDGRFVCASCDRKFDTFAARGVHMRRCDGGSWRCMWCSAKASETSGKGPGPDGPGTLCSACSGRYRSGHTGPPQQDEEGRYVCECSRTFDTIAAMGVHRRHCDGGKWHCGWCGCGQTDTSGKGPGPDGPRTLCAACASRFRAGHREPPQRDAAGKFLCSCGRGFESMSGLGSHRRRCPQALSKPALSPANGTSASSPGAEAYEGAVDDEARAILQDASESTAAMSEDVD